MVTLVAQIAPQRSTQYTTLAKTLASHELKLSPLGNQIFEIDYLELAGQTYVQFEMAHEPNEDQALELGMLAMTSAFFIYYERLCNHVGPFLYPIDVQFRPMLPPDIVTTRRYKGKTNEMFTHFLCNIARFSSGFSDCSWKTLRVFDPLAGGGTTLFSALVLGADVAGVEKNIKDIQSTAAFLKEYTKEQGIVCKVKEEQLKKLGKRWWFTIGSEMPQQCVLTAGETAQSDKLLAGVKKSHFIVADLPYGIQHHGQLTTLLSEALPVWTSMLIPKGTMVLAWEATRFSRKDMITLIESKSQLVALDDPPYNQLAHRVDRVIKQRDVIVAHLI